MTTPSLCPSLEQLTAFAEGTAPEQVIEALVSHVDQCTSCERTLSMFAVKRLSVDGTSPLSSDAPTSVDTLCEDYQSLRTLLYQLPRLHHSSISNGQSYWNSKGALHDQEIRAIFGSSINEDCLGKLGPFQIESLLGRGGMGMVFAATDTRLYRRVAIKVMRIARASDPQLVERFYREARALAAVESEHVVRIYEVGELPTSIGPLPFLSMEILEGCSLDHYDRRAALHFSEVLSIAIQLTKGLAAVHETGMVHRDIKPGNIWIAPEDSIDTPPHVRLLDFGLAHFEQDLSVLTQTGDLIGTPAYMSPEAALGKKHGVRSDLFSLGIVLYELSSGNHPFMRGSTPAILLALTRETPMAPHRVNAQVCSKFSRVVMSLLERSPQRRPSSCNDVLETLLEIQSTLSEYPVKDPSSKKRKPRFPRLHHSRRLVITGVGMIIVLICASLGWTIHIETDMGTLVIESPIEDLEIKLLKNGKPILQRVKGKTLQIAAGEYQIELPESFNHLKLSKDSVKIVRQSREVIHITLPRSEGSASHEVLDAHQKPNLGTDNPEYALLWNASTWGKGDLVQDGDETLLTCSQEGFRVFYGDENLQEFDLSVEVLQEEGNGNIFLVFAAQPPENRYQVSLGSFHNGFLGIDRWVGDTWTGISGTPFSVEKGRWLVVRLSVRDTFVTATVDHQIQTQSPLPAGTRGLLGIGISSGRTRFRNHRVTTPDGKLIHQGFPSPPALYKN